MGIRCRKTGRISARPAGCTEETLHQFALLKKRTRMTANVQILWGERRGLVRRMAGDSVSGKEMHHITQVRL
jgi:hypothetical protein